LRIVVMATLSAPAFAGSTHSVLDPNRPDLVGAMLSAVLPLAFVLSVNGLASMAGVDIARSHFAAPLGTPEWVTAMVWSAILPMWGIARWTLWQKGRAGRSASFWVLGLIGAATFVPLLSIALTPFWSAAATLLLLILAVIVAMRVFAVSKAAFLWMAPSLGWMSIATLLGFSAAAHGWSPPFAVTQGQS
jgi:tryptophan-rich sensory protein